MLSFRQKIVDYLKQGFPTATVKLHHGVLDEGEDGGITYNASGLFVCPVDVTEAPVQHDPWDLLVETGVVVVYKHASALERDRQCELLTMRTVEKLSKQCFGYSRMLVTPWTLTAVRRRQQRRQDGSFTGLSYWTIQGTNMMKFEVATDEDL